ncbi:GNAT family N-acetyltransferase [Lacticaseibacillus brantae]|uniref:N-acetyltransferase domain-containing protein n=1 Tax=Lacticaseibacillus brantae DSM 23927 TaxID=1423727 RepID=A0A0R2B5W8_9LACO|nr:GNAT family N-acetyltransferase [Lacticaseibacillus brantae]KRM71819.1 hypothetical protein FC34_GL001480 [Lacticaseibacillus brantae DSM 23927]
MITYTKTIPSANQLETLYAGVGWTAYTQNITGLRQAFEHSVFITASSGTELVGVIRGVTDRRTILYIQDLLVLPNYQHQGIATKLLQQLTVEYSTGQVVLLTDDTDIMTKFYTAVGMQAVDQHGLRAFFKDTR